MNQNSASYTNLQVRSILRAHVKILSWIISQSFKHYLIICERIWEKAPLRKTRIFGTFQTVTTQKLQEP